MISLKPTAEASTAKLPKAAYQWRIKKASFEISKNSKNAMYVMDCEVVAPETFAVDGVEYKTAGLEARLYCVLEEGKTQTITALHTQLGFPLEFETNEETNMPEGIEYEGQIFEAVGYSEEYESKDAAGNQIVSSSGKPLKGHQNRIGQIL